MCRIFKILYCKRIVYLPVIVLGLYYILSAKFLSKGSVRDISTEEDWSKVSDDIYILSAYWDTRDIPLAPFVRIIAISLRKEDSEESCNCVLQYNNGEKLFVPFKKEIIVEHWSKLHSAVFFICSAQRAVPPAHVKITCDSNSSDWKNVMALTGGSNRNKMVVCVRPFFGFRNWRLEIAEFIAFYDIMGVSHFTFYDYQTSNETKTFLAELKNHTNVELLRWSLPKSVVTWQMGQLAFIQECIYRHMKEFEFVIIVDIDEYMVPKKNHTLISLANIEPGYIGSILFRNTFFCKHHLNSTSLMTQHLTTRTQYVLNATERSKVILRSKAIVMCSIHYVAKYVRGFSGLVLQPHEGLLHHYREGFCAEKTLIEDKTALMYRLALTEHAIIKLWNVTNSKKMT